MTNLSVNINKVATLRNARGENVPDVERVAVDCETFGAQGITVHPRPDERHIKHEDVFALRPLIKTEFNIEGYPSPEFMDLVLKVKPEQVTLVPDAPDALTSNAGWNVTEHKEFLTEIIDRLREAGIRSSVFVDPDVAMIKAAAKTGADRVELYTKPYADMYPSDPEKAVAPYVEASKAAHNCGLGVAYNTHRCPAYQRNHSHLAGGKSQGSILTFFCHELCAVACRTNKLSALAGIQFNIV